MRRAAIVFAWLAGTAVAIGLGVEAVDVVAASLTTTERPAPLSAAAVSEALTSTTTGPAATTSTEPAPTSTTAPTTPTTTRPGTGTTRPTPTTTATTGPPTTTPTTAPAAAFPPPEDRTYRLIGGTVGVRFADGGAHLLWATPQPGFRVETHHTSPEVDVRFESEDHESRLEAVWDNGPRAEVEEHAED